MPRSPERPKPKTDPHYWNFGLLDPIRDLDARGQMRWIRMPEGEAAVAAGVSATGMLFCLLRAHPAVRVWDPYTQALAPLWSPQPGEVPAALCVRRDSLYILERTTRTVRRVSPSQPNVHVWPLECDRLDDFAQLEVAELGERATSCAIVGPTESGRFPVIALASDPAGVAPAVESSLARFKELAALAGPFGMCADPLRSSLIVAESQRHRVLELEWQASKARVLCGTGAAGPAFDGESPGKLAVDGARSVALCRRNGVSAAFLDPKSRSFVEADRAGGYPRSVIIADTGNNVVRRLIEMGDHPGLLSLRSLRLLHTLLGGAPPESPASAEAASYVDLRQCPAPGPLHVSVSARGDLTIVLDSGRAILWLQPASVAAELKLTSSAKEYYEHS